MASFPPNVVTIPAGRFRFPQYQPPTLGALHPQIAAMTAFGQRLSLCEDGKGCVSPADPRVGIVRVAPKETVETYRGVRIVTMPTGGLTTVRKFPGDRRIGGGRANRRQVMTPLYAQNIAQMRRQIDRQLAPLDGIGGCGCGKDGLGEVDLRALAASMPKPQSMAEAEQQLKATLAQAQAQAQHQQQASTPMATIEAHTYKGWTVVPVKVPGYTTPFYEATKAGAEVPKSPSFPDMRAMHFWIDKYEKAHSNGTEKLVVGLWIAGVLGTMYMMGRKAMKGR